LLGRILFSSGQISFAPFFEVLQSEMLLTALKNTMIVSIGVTILSWLLAVPTAWLLTRTDLPYKNKLRSWLCLPYAIPPYIGAIAWIFLANPSTGLLNKLAGTQWINIYSMGGLIWVETSFLYTFVLLTALSSLDRMDSSFEEAARLSGAHPRMVFRTVTLPLIRPALFSGGLLVFLATAASFGVPALIGSPGQLYFLTTQIYTLQRMGTESGLLKSGALSIGLLFFALCILAINHAVLSKQNYQTVSGKTSRPSSIELGASKYLFLFLLLAFWFVVFCMPLLGIAISAFSRVQGELALSNFTLDNVTRTLFETDETSRALTNSFGLATTAAVIVSLLGLLLAYIQYKTKLKGRQMMEIMASLPYSAPGTVVALALILSFAKGFLGIGPSLYGTWSMLLLAYVVKYLSFGIKTTGDGFRQIDDVLAEASRVAGANWTQTMVRIWLPLLKPSLVAAFFLVFMPVLSELTMTVILSGPGLETIGTLIFQLQEYADASGGGASVLALLIVLIVLFINESVKRLSRGRYGL
jgi:iron(III) transport system permease protein